MAKERLFFAVALDESLHQAASHLLADLQKGAIFTGAHPKWVDPEGLHITLRFLGATDSGRIAKIKQLVEEVVSGVEAFPFSIEKLGVFPDERNPKVIWAGVKQGSKPLSYLGKRIEMALAPLGFEPEARLFHPHLTLARLTAQRGQEALVKMIQSHRGVIVGDGIVEKVTLFKSEDLPEGVKYEVVHEFPLKKQKQA